MAYNFEDSDFDNGWSAYHAGVPLTHCPYENCLGRHWRAGWVSAAQSEAFAKNCKEGVDRPLGAL